MHTHTASASPADISLWRLAAAGLALLPAFLLNSQDVMMATLIMGPSHALLAFLAQRKAGYYRERRRNALFLSLFAMAIAAGLAFPLYFIFFVSGFFILHNFLDDIVLFNTTPNGSTQAVGLYAFLLFLVINIDSSFDLHLMRDYIWLWAAGLPLTALLVARERHTPQAQYLFFIWMNALALLALSWLATGTAMERLPVENVFCFLVVTHYLNWYVYIFKKKQAREPRRPGELRSYVRQCLISNAFFVALFFFTRQLGQDYGLMGSLAGLVYVGVFHVVTFNIFTFMHLATTARADDYIPKLTRAS